MRDALKTMPRLLNRTAGRPCTLTLKLEDFESDWRGATARLWDLIGVSDRATFETLERVALRHNVYGGGSSGRYNAHVSVNRTAKGRLRAQLASMPEQYELLQQARARLGYPIVGKEGRQHAAPR